VLPVKSKPPITRAARFEELRRESAKLLGVKVSDLAVQRRATLVLMLEVETSKLIDGMDVSPAVLAQLEAQIAAITPTKPIEVKVELIGGTDDAHCHVPGCGGDIIEICTCCNRIPGEDPNRPAKRRVIDPANELGSEPAPKLTLVDSTPAPAASPPMSRPAGISASEFHDQILPDGSRPPIKRSAVSNGSGSLVWSGYEGGHRQFGTATPDTNPNYNSDGSPRSPFRSPY
jgi:hypothetical protein